MNGWLSQYDEAPTAYTIIYRQEEGTLPLDLSPYDGVIATADCDNIGREGWLTAEGQTMHIIVFDCSGHASTTGWMGSNGIIAEVGFYLAEKLGIVGRGGIEGTLVLR